MTDREKLTKLLLPMVESELECDCSSLVRGWADHLLFNGVTFQKWIPVTERLPEKDKEVLCLLGGEFWLAVWNHCDDGLWTDGERWVSKCFVTHWMPLPKRPNE